MATALALFGAAEVGLRLAGFRFALSSLDAPIFKRAPDGTHMKTSAMFVSHHCRPQSFFERKAPGVVRIILAGDSSVYRLGNAERLVRRLSQRLSRPVEILNMGFAACGSERVLLSVREALRYDPDAIVVHVGHSEFVSLCNPATTLDSKGRPGRPIRIPDWRLAQFLAQWLSSLRPPSWQKAVSRMRRYSQGEKEEFYKTFADNLSAMALAAQARGIPLVFCTVAYSYEPSRSGVDGLTGAIAALPPRLKPAQVRECIERALLATAVPIRADRRINEIIRSTARRTGAPLIDTQTVIVRHAPDRMPGGDLFDDHCHLNGRGNRILLDALAEALPRYLRP